jgi:Rrf2 family protein
VRTSKTARYALHAALEMALAGDQPVTVAGVAGALKLPQTALAKVFQQLVRSGLAVGTRGIGGGYRLARPPREVSVLDVLQAFEPPQPPGRCLLVERGNGACPRTGSCGLQQLFDEAEELVRCTFASVTLATLARRTGGRGHSPDRKGRGARPHGVPASPVRDTPAK